MMMQSIPVQASGMVNGAMGFADIVRRSGESKFELFLDNRIKTETKISDKAKAVNVGKADRTTIQARKNPTRLRMLLRVLSIRL